MSEKFNVRWGVDDGHVGGGRPHYFKISDNDLWEGMDDKELAELFWTEIQNEFEQNIHYYSADEQQFIDWAKTRISEQSRNHDA